jgi:hypothetical protein
MCEADPKTADRSPGREHRVQHVTVEHTIQPGLRRNVGRANWGIRLKVTPHEPEQVDDLGAGRHAHVGCQREACIPDVFEVLRVPGNQLVFEGLVVHAAHHPPNERPVGQSHEGTILYPSRCRRAEKMLQLQFVTEGRDQLGRDCLDPGVKAVVDFLSEVESRHRVEARVFCSAVLKRDLAHVQQKKGRLHVAGRVDL